MGAVANGNYRYKAINGYGKSDGGTLKASAIHYKLLSYPQNWPMLKELLNTSIKPSLPLLEDEAFPLLENLLELFNGVPLTAEQKIYIYRLSRAFGI